MGDIYLSREGYEKLRKELEHLSTVKRREISKAIGEARQHGDLKENAEYDAAKDAQAHNELRIHQLQDKLSRARLIDDEDIPKDEVLIGATVHLKDEDTGEELAYTVVSEEEADFENNKISFTSPLGAGLMNHKANDLVSIEVPAGTLKYRILRIER